MSYPLAELPVRIEDLEINGPTVYGYAPLQERLARYTGVPQECVFAAAGTSFSNHMAMAATFDPGDEVLIEHPTYELLESTARYLGARIRRFERRLEDGFRIDPDEVERQVTPAIKLIILTNLHNPTGAYADEATIRAVGEIAKSRGARVSSGRSLSGGILRSAPSPSISLWRSIPGDQQLDQGLRAKRPALRMGSRRPGTCA